MATAPVGTLRADLALESAAFIRDLKKAADATARNTSAMRKSMAGLQTGFAAAGSAIKGVIAGFFSVAAVRGLVQLGRTAVQTGDDIATAATKIGISGEELQRFRFAAEQADVGVAELDNTIKLFQKGLATGKIESQSFSDFIQSIRDAPTHIEKVRIATEALGGKAFQSAILLADAGDQFIKNYREAFVVSQEALKAAGDLDNEWRSLTEAIGTGFQTGYLGSFSGNVKRSHEELARFNEVAEAFGRGFGSIITGVNRIASAFVNLRETIFNAREEIRKQQAERAGKDFIPEIDGATQANRPLAQFAETFKPKIDELNQSLISNADAAKLASEANRAWLERLAAGAQIFEATRGPFEQLKIDLENLSELYRQGSIDAEAFGRAQTMAAASAVQPWLQVASTIGGALGQLFDDNKAVAIAQAVINTAQGVTAALAQYPPPLSFAMAAAQAAAGAVQIATIKSAKPGTSGAVKRPSAGGGSGKAVSSSSSSPAPAQAQRAIFVNLQGSGRYTRDEVFGLIEQLVEAQKDGAQLVLSQP